MKEEDMVIGQRYWTNKDVRVLNGIYLGYDKNKGHQLNQLIGTNPGYIIRDGVLSFGTTHWFAPYED